ncbi:MAG: SPASM domain-containing protein [Bacteroidota bacterium]
MNPRLQDQFNLLSRFTPRRGLNALRIWSSYHLSRLFRSNLHWGMPVSVAIEPTTSCNLRCPECPSGLRAFSRPTGMIDQSSFRKIIDELYRDIVYLTFYFQGEPYLNPHFLQMVRYANGKNIYTSTSTNAHYLDEEKARETVESGLDRLIISIDGTTQEAYQSYRVGGRLAQVISGTKNIIRWKKILRSRTPLVVFQFLVVRPNEHQVPELLRLAAELGVDDVQFKTAQVYDHANGHALIPRNEDYSRYRKNADGTYSIKNKMEDHCWRMWQSCVITWDGKVVPCCFDKDAAHRLGDLRERTFRSIWKSRPYGDFRASVLRARSSITICRNCSEGSMVWA